MLSRIDLTIWILVILVPAVLIYARLQHLGWLRVLSLLALVTYLSALAGVVFGPIPIDARLIADLRSEEVDLTNNLAPLTSILEMARSQPVDVLAYQVGGNLILLGPLGFLLPALFSRFERLSRTLLAGLVVTLVIEFVQLFTSQLLGFTYKLFDVDDILLNTAGVVFGWTLWWVISKLVPFSLLRQAHRAPVRN